MDHDDEQRPFDEPVASSPFIVPHLRQIVSSALRNDLLLETGRLSFGIARHFIDAEAL